MNLQIIKQNRKKAQKIDTDTWEFSTYCKGGISNQWINLDCSLNGIEMTEELCGKYEGEFILYMVYPDKI